MGSLLSTSPEVTHARTRRWFILERNLGASTYASRVRKQEEAVKQAAAGSNQNRRRGPPRSPPPRFSDSSMRHPRSLSLLVVAVVVVPRSCATAPAWCVAAYILEVSAHLELLFCSFSCRSTDLFGGPCVLL
ncbi:hypothetical protein VOLCADRAFT_100258 [Volvox carteri f. nagariensis]|uniref:Uncharacterized protein n=1 Tax=Volvox carteri f. nagariensis TaxID=3068 RepID=D8UJU6_VOLCA|nr:uncharacterized protein VOLCADRAFT_100258 [Volvox carteri f. nagariensis]EFJ40002.1 hypothetical protein VOLCADRAFT_100258 [Volvox carteri f. nagariensis]|eukprot:XP_002958922.1 hypothetical protein VOLCADRAFT_100258 [Volvox carteri f. nagariensis]